MSRAVIVEEDPDVAEVVRFHLERAGIGAVVAPTGEAGLSAALGAGGAPSLIIIDLVLPSMRGAELCRRLRAEPATQRTPIIILAEGGEEISRQAALALSADDYVTKPFSVKELLARVHAALHREAG